jgi:hypothetical protein
MRVVVLFVLACIAHSAVAEQSVPVVLYESTDGDGHRVQYRSDTKTLWDTPQWTPGGEGPQLSLEAATKIAMDAGMRQVPKANGISFGDIKLLKNVLDYSGGRVVTWFGCSGSRRSSTRIRTNQRCRLSNRRETL